MAVMVDEELVAQSSANSSSQSKRRSVRHYLAKCVLHGSAVLHAVQGHLRSPHSVDIVFAKETSLELAIIGEDGVIQSIFEQSIFGTIKDLAILPWSDKYPDFGLQRQGIDLLVVLSDSGKLSFLNFCSEMHRFFSLTHIELSKPGNSIKQLGRMLAVDPGGSFVAVSAYEDCFAVFPISLSIERNIVYEKILYPSESNGDMGITKETARTSVLGVIWSMCFISSNSQRTDDCNPILAIIVHRKGSVLNDLVLFSCNPKMHSIHAISQYSEAGPLAMDISAIPHLPGYALLLRKGDVLLLDLRDPNNIGRLHKVNLNVPNVEEHSYVEEACRGLDADDEGMFNVAASALLELRDSGVDVVKDYDPMTVENSSDVGSKVICSWTWETGNSTSSRLIFCLDTGEIYLADIHMDHHGIQVNLSDCVYRGLSCKALLWIKGGLVAGLVEMGDGFVLRWEDNGLVYKSSIQNIAPILDLSIVDYHDGKQDQMFACCGMGLEGSLRIIRSGISVENLLKTAPIYQGVSGTWTMKMKRSDNFHSFLVLSFIEETRVLSVGLSFSDVTEAVGFLPDVCTIACGLVADGLLVQIHKTGIRLCLPTALAHLEGVPLSEPMCSSWSPNNVTISVGAVGRGLITIATSNPCFLSVLGVRSLSAYQCEVYEIQQVRLQHEVSCISIPVKIVEKEELSSEAKTNCDHEASLGEKNIINTAFVIGTHRPSIEVLLFDHQGTVKVLAVGLITINNALGGPISGCIPEDVKLVSIDRPYILAGLRNGMLLRFEWPEVSVLLSQLRQYIPSHYTPIQYKPNNSSSLMSFSSANEMEKTKHSLPISLELIAIRRIGITPVVLVPMQDSLDSDIIVLSDRTWLLHTARHSLAYTSISFQPATHVTPVCSVDCPKGILFVADNSLNLVEMVHCKRLNVQKFCLGGTPRKVIFHAESKTLLVMRIGLSDELCSSDICRVDPVSGSLISKFKCQPGETAKCMQVVNVGKEQVLIVGTSQSSGRTVMPSGEAESTRGRLLVLSLDGLHTYTGGSSHNYYPSMNMSSHVGYPFGDVVGGTSSNSPDDSCSEGLQLDEAGAGQLKLLYPYTLSAAVLSVCSYLDRFVLAAAGNTLNVFGFLNENPQRLRKLAFGRTRFAITCLKTNSTRIAVGDCRDGLLFYSYHEDIRKLEQLFSDPAQRLVADCALVDCDTAVVSDRRGSISVLSCPNLIEAVSGSPEKNLMLNCSFYMGETVMSIQKASISCKLPVDDLQNGSDAAEIVQEYAYNSVIASTLIGSVFVLIPVTSEEQALLEAVQARLALHPLTCPILGNDHREYRTRGQPAGVSTILDGDMLAQFLELTSLQQESVLSSFGLNARASALDLHQRPLSVNQVVGLLERVHYALN